MVLDVESQRLINEAVAAGRRPLSELSVAEVRAFGQARIAQYGNGPEMHSVWDERVQSSGGYFTLRVFVPSAQPRGVLVFFHGGGWVVGDINEYEAWARSLAERTGLAIVLPNYRKAPEFPFPHAIDDSNAAVRWVVDNRERISPHPLPLMVGGDSAGGNLAIVATLQAMNDKEVDIRASVLIYPVTDADFDRASYVDPSNQLLLSRAGMQWFFAHYADSQDLSDPRISPLRAPDLSGFPRTFVLHAEYDPLLDEGREFVERLRASGTAVTVHFAAGEMHGYMPMVRVLAASSAAIDTISQFVVDVLEEENS